MPVIHYTAMGAIEMGPLTVGVVQGASWAAKGVGAASSWPSAASRARPTRSRYCIRTAAGTRQSAPGPAESDRTRVSLRNRTLMLRDHSDPLGNLRMGWGTPFAVAGLQFDARQY